MHLAPKSSTSTQPPLPDAWVESIFDEMLLAYGKKFTDQWGSADPDKLITYWTVKLAGYTWQELERGIAALDGRGWPPTLPEFKQLCRPGLDSTVAYYEAVNGMAARERGEVGTWSHPAIFWAAVQVSAFDLKNQPYTQIKARWEKAFSDEMEKGSWAEIPKPMIALPAPGKTKLDREEATKRLQELGASEVLRVKNNQREWAHKIMERKAAKDSTLPDISVRFAEQALGIRK